jgi:hypothetical protein
MDSVGGPWQERPQARDHTDDARLFSWLHELMVGNTGGQRRWS